MKKDPLKKTINYIGTFPPPYGGITIRNSEFHKALSQYYNIKIFDTAKIRNIINYIQLVSFLLINRKNSGVISISTPSLLKLTKIISKFTPFLMVKYLIITAGGTVDKQLKNSNINTKILNKYLSYFVETNKLKSTISNFGLNNVNYLPNCRLEPKNRNYRERETGKIKFISISRIAFEKGIDTILKADYLINNLDQDYIIDFYGPIDNDIKNIFFEGINNSNKMSYKGVFEGDKQDINDLLIEYDVLLFPTKHSSEGHPGVLTNAKIAGCTIIATDLNANAEIVKHNIDGLIIGESDPCLLKEDMLKLINNIDLLNNLKAESFKSANDFFIEKHIHKLIECLD